MDEEASTGSNQPAQLAEGRDGIGQVFEHVNHRNEIELAGNITRSAHVECVDAGNRFHSLARSITLLGSRQRPGRQLSGVGLEECTLSAADVEQTTAVGNRGVAS